MRRGERWTVAGGGDYAGKPRFVVIVQPNDRNGLRSICRLMVDKITTVPKAKMGAQMGRLDDEDMVRLNQAMTVFLGMAVTPRAGRRRNPDN